MEPPDRQPWEPPDDVPRLPVTLAAPGSRRLPGVGREPSPALVGGVALAVLAAGVVALVSRDSSSEPRAATECAAAVDRVPGSPNHRHGAIEWDAVPPDSGEHNPVPLPPIPRLVVRDVAFAPERAVHNLEHGYVIVWYDAADGDLDALRETLDAVRERKLLAVPWDRGGLGDGYVLTAWGHAQTCDGPPSATAVQAFYDEHGGVNGEAPEKSVPF